MADGDTGGKGDVECQDQNNNGVSPTLIRALNHPLRRQILRLLGELGESHSPSWLTKFVTVPRSNVSYHMTVLEELGAVRQTSTRRIRGATEGSFASEVINNERVVSILAGTEEADKDMRKHK